MTKWQPTNTILYINSIFHSKGMEVEKVENNWYKVLDFNGNVLGLYTNLYKVIMDYKDLLYPSYEYDDMEEI